MKGTKKPRDNKNDFEKDTDTVLNMINNNNKQKGYRGRKAIEKKKQKIAKRHRKVRAILRVIVIVATIAGGITFVLVSPIFNVIDIEVTNNNQVSEEEIVYLSGLHLNQNLFRFSSNRVTRNLRQNPYIQAVEIKRNFPNRVELIVRERERNFNIILEEGIAYINNQGFILEIAYERVDVPTIIGIRTPEENIEPGNRLGKEDLERLEIVLRIMNAFRSVDLADKVTSIDITSTFNYVIFMEEEMKTIHLGDASNLSNRILWVQGILEKNVGKEGEIFVDGDLNNRFRPRFKEKVQI